jgi:hypothetical protein
MSSQLDLLMLILFAKVRGLTDDEGASAIEKTCNTKLLFDRSSISECNMDGRGCFGSLLVT